MYFFASSLHAHRIHSERNQVSTFNRLKFLTAFGMTSMSSPFIECADTHAKRSTLIVDACTSGRHPCMVASPFESRHPCKNHHELVLLRSAPNTKASQLIDWLLCFAAPFPHLLCYANSIASAVDPI